MTLFEPAPILPVEVRMPRRLKNASGQLKGHTILINIPHHWPKGLKNSTISDLSNRIQKQFDRYWALVHQDYGPRVTLDSQYALTQWVFELNEITLRQHVKGVKLGQSKFTRLAQMNTQSQQMTVSKYCCQDSPERALQYLVIHELAHLLEANHSKRFWSHVARFIPDYKAQNKLIQATHQINLYKDALKNPLPQAITSEGESTGLPSGLSEPSSGETTRRWRQLPLFPAWLST